MCSSDLTKHRSSSLRFQIYQQKGQSNWFTKTKKRNIKHGHAELAITPPLYTKESDNVERPNDVLSAESTPGALGGPGRHEHLMAPISPLSPCLHHHLSLRGLSTADAVTTFFFFSHTTHQGLGRKQCCGIRPQRAYEQAPMGGEGLVGGWAMGWARGQTQSPHTI